MNDVFVEKKNRLCKIRCIKNQVGETKLLRKLCKLKIVYKKSDQKIN